MSYVNHGQLGIINGRLSLLALLVYVLGFGGLGIV